MKSWNYRIGMFLVFGLFFTALFGPFFAPHNPIENFSGCENQAPSLTQCNENIFLLGTDALGRDLLSRLIYGARHCVIMGVFSIALASLIGIPLGLIAGGVPRLDTIISKASDILMSFPTILIAIIIVSILGPGYWNAVVAVGVCNIPSFIRLTRAQTLLEAKKDYVLAAESLGAQQISILLRHILPNITSSLIVLFSLGLGSAILESASLSFLNLGVRPPTPEWGSMIRDGMESFLSINPWISSLSGFCIFLTVLGFNLLGDALNEKWDPLSKKHILLDRRRRARK